MSPSSDPIHLAGQLWIQAGNARLAGHERINLLRQIVQTGSITQAAKACGMSYKAAWDAVNTMNNLADSPLVERLSGGRGGGSTRLTPRGHALIEQFEKLEAQHQRFITQLNQAPVPDTPLDSGLLPLLSVKTSARNQLSGTVTTITSGAVNDDIQLALGDGDRIHATITCESTESLALASGCSCMALIKASAVMLATGETRTLSVANQLTGTILAIQPGAVHSEVTLALKGQRTLTAMLTQPSIAALELAPGKPATALFQASDVILMRQI